MLTDKSAAVERVKITNPRGNALPVKRHPLSPSVTSGKPQANLVMNEDPSILQQPLNQNKINFDPVVQINNAISTSNSTGLDLKKAIKAGSSACAGILGLTLYSLGSHMARARVAK